jgi:hypothetical protein
LPSRFIAVRRDDRSAKVRESESNRFPSMRAFALLNTGAAPDAVLPLPDSAHLNDAAVNQA